MQYSAIHFGSRWKIRTEDKLKNTDNTQIKTQPRNKKAQLTL